ncbi:MAG: hypothetical protein ACI8TX_002930, partial [Hyphomicrobiaceae bacterium]
MLLLMDRFSFYGCFHFRIQVFKVPLSKIGWGRVRGS